MTSIGFIGSALWLPLRSSAATIRSASLHQIIKSSNRKCARTIVCSTSKAAKSGSTDGSGSKRKKPAPSEHDTPSLFTSSFQLFDPVDAKSIKSRPSQSPLFGSVRLNPSGVEEFLKNYWNKKPCLFRNAIPGFESPISPDELAGLSLEQDVESRIVIHWGESNKTGKPEYEGMYGPFEEDQFSKLPGENYTLLVNEVNRHVPWIHDLLSYFTFIPNWRVDDVMVSYAAKGGGVGPHVDNYDVFLLQAKGTRTWRISDMAIAPQDEQIIPDINVNVLQGGFPVKEEMICHPGDLLYLPPRCPHWGTAEKEDDCMTYSIGFRAPKYRELVYTYGEHVADEYINPDQFYADNNDDLLANYKQPGLISPDAIQRVRSMILEKLNDETAFMQWFGMAVTEPKRYRQGSELNDLMLDDKEAQELVDKIFPPPKASKPKPSKPTKGFSSASGPSLTSKASYDNAEDGDLECVVTEACIYAYTVNPNTKQVMLFINGDEPLVLPPACLSLVQLLCSRKSVLTASTFRRLAFEDEASSEHEIETRVAESRRVVKLLFTKGYLSVSYPDEGEAEDEEE